MSILLTSPGTIETPPHSERLQVVLAQASLRGVPVVVVSNHPKPAWFDTAFAGSRVQFQFARGRQNGAIVRQLADNHLLEPHDVLVLAGNEVDIQMAKNGGAVTLALGWCKLNKIRKLGIQVTNPNELATVLDLIVRWRGQWWYQGKEAHYTIKALADLSTYGKAQPLATFAAQLTNTVKHGGAKLNSLLAITARSLMTDGFDEVKLLAWGIYPSSGSKNDDTDALSDFGHRLRTTVSKVHFAERGEPLLIRHRPSPKRSAGGTGNRHDPTDQIKSLHLNPHYRDKLNGKHVVMLDDCTTYGVSFGVAAALLREAGASGMTGIALGKFGSQLKFYDIELLDDPFEPVDDFHIKTEREFNGTSDPAVQRDLRDLI